MVIDPSSPFHIQIVAGSYDRILHGITATVAPVDADAAGKEKETRQKASFADTFLFSAHTSAIRCLAVSPPSKPVPGQAQKVFLASGSTDERINVYNLSVHPPSRKSQEKQKALAVAGLGKAVMQNRKNRELGTLLHHSSTVTALAFPTRGKLVSSSEDSTVGITRTRDWALLSSVKAPVPVPKGRPSGDTAALGSAPCGVNDFAVHPSLKTMITVSKGERCMRLWNLVTGKRGGVLNFTKDVLREVGEGRHSSGEGRKVVWGSTEKGEEFAVVFDRDVVVFSMDAVVKCRVLGGVVTKVHAVRYLVLDPETERSLLAVSTEDGRILFFSTRDEDLAKPEPPATMSTAKLVASIGGKDAGVANRIKDFTILRRGDAIYIVAGSSDGTIRLWRVAVDEFNNAMTEPDTPANSVGELLAVYQTHNRITCLEAFELIPTPDGVQESEDDDDEDLDENGLEDDSESDAEEES